MTRAAKLKKPLLVIATVIVALAAVLIYYYNAPISKKIDTKVVGIQYAVNSPIDEYETREITIQGTYTHYLFGNKNDLYKGTFSIEGYDCTFNRDAMLPLFPRGAIEFGGSPLWYPGFPGGNSCGAGGILGEIFCTNLTEFVIALYEPIYDNTDTWNGLVICAPASNREEANKIIDRLVAPDSWLVGGNGLPTIV
jgi:hypothetical protein